MERSSIKGADTTGKDEKRTPVQSLKGFRYFYPENMKAREEVIRNITDTVRSYNFCSIDMPSLEPLELLEKKSGQEISKQLFAFKDKGDRNVTLIPETTPSVASMVAKKGVSLAKPARWFSWTKTWRYEEPQSGRLREFYQLNVDTIGTQGAEADAEILAISASIMLNLKLGGKFVIKISDRELMGRILAGIGISPPESVFRVIDRYNKVDKNTFSGLLAKEGVNDEQCEKIQAILGFGGSVPEVISKLQEMGIETGDSATRLGELWKLLDEYKVSDNFKVDLSIVRGLAYYTGMVFECQDTNGKLRAIFGGGRYDGLISMLGGGDVPAVGFAMGDVVLELLMKECGVWPEEKVSADFYVAAASDEQRMDVKRVACALRARGYITEIDISERNISKQLKNADRSGARHVIIIGDDEQKNGTLTIKDMSIGEQKTIRRDEFLRTFSL